MTATESKKTTPSTVQALLQSHNDSGGVVVNDPNGLCLLNKGDNMIGNGNDTGALTSLTRLAQKLQNGDSSHPLIALEYDTAAILLKDYDGHAVALQVPKDASKAGEATTEGNADDSAKS